MQCMVNNVQICGLTSGVYYSCAVDSLVIVFCTCMQHTINTHCSDGHFLYTLQMKRQHNLDKTLTFALYSLLVCQLSLGSYGLQFAVCAHV